MKQDLNKISLSERKEKKKPSPVCSVRKAPFVYLLPTNSKLGLCSHLNEVTT